MSFRTWATLAGLVAGTLVVGACVGALVEHARMTAHVQTATARAASAEEATRDIAARAVAVNDGFGTRLNIAGANQWLGLIRANPDIDFKECFPAKPSPMLL
jgi:hypothetical protein